jgi:hypothetical protein
MFGKNILDFLFSNPISFSFLVHFEQSKKLWVCQLKTLWKPFSTVECVRISSFYQRHAACIISLKFLMHMRSFLVMSQIYCHTWINLQDACLRWTSLSGLKRVLLFEVEHVKLDMIFTNLSLVLLGFTCTSQLGDKTYSYIYLLTSFNVFLEHS